MELAMVSSQGTINWSGDLDHRKAFARFPTGVTVITTRAANGAPVGLTVNSFSSVSLDPPLILWSLRTTSVSRNIFREAPYFAVNILSKDQEELSRQFCGPVEERFSGVDYVDGIEDTPVLTGCAAVIECARQDIVTWGDHDVICGRIIRHAYSEKEPLAFLGGQYGGFSAQSGMS